MEAYQKLIPIGIIHSPYSKAEGTPIQSAYAEGAEDSIEILPEFWDGLSDLDGFECVWLIYFFDRTAYPRLKVIPFRDIIERGVFATRAPSRPNFIGF
ncbi:MAG TPA: tRNA (N6-threonylcarbamoyladenosine(37)-N6)-methyltransferase TrmO, partial [candidate division Zixibacteria bacterium]|nr:tRNA (N6-threonylcarbamoyladenosine(37)-N6)-methyltransferase TrmO [candidate division Zixibacteria bacterium]